MWRKELPKHFYRPLGEVAVSGFVTKERLTPEQAMKRPFQPMPPGTPWGAKWEYGWFRGTIQLPEEAAGERIVLNLMVNGSEAVIWVNGQMIESHRGAWEYALLAMSARGDERFEFLTESYAWHGQTPCEAGPTPPGRAVVPEPPTTQQIVGKTSFGIWEEEAWQLHMDVETLTLLRQAMDPTSLRVAQVDKALRDYTVIMDFEQPAGKYPEMIRAARARLAPLLACRNGSSTPEMFCFGQGHLDVAWLWPLEETRRKAARTLANQLTLIDEYPQHIFLHSQPQLFAMVKQDYPDLYARIRKAVAAGNIVPEGAMWVEADTNITGGEAMIRQFLHGKRFVRDEFGLDNELMWLPDVFGYSAAIPQILRGCGVKYFSTQKIFWNYHGGETFPYHNFLWQGIDGSEVIAHIHNDYNSPTRPDVMIDRWRQRVQPDGMSTRLVPFGHGDGGGGPTREHLEFIRRMGDLEGCPKMRLAGPVAFFEDLIARGEHNLNRYVGELYFQAHRGVLTSQARTKRGNRKSEVALREAEMWGAAAGALATFKWPAESMDAVWKKLLLHQFHDILPGSSIHRVYVEAEAALGEVVAEASKVAADAAAALTKKADALTIFNSLSWPRKVLVTLPENWKGATDSEGDDLCVTLAQGRKLVETTAPACGWTTLTQAPGPRSHCDGGPARAHAAATSLENDQLRVTFDAQGQIVSVFDKAAGRELLSGVSNVFRMFKDVPVSFDAWDIDSTYMANPVDLGAEPATIEVLARGPLIATLRVGRKLADSTITQEISLRRGARRVELATVVDWHERHKLLKVAFRPDIHAENAIHEIQFGHVIRPNHYSRQYDSDRFEVAQQRWTALAEEGRGFAVLNDCKYGVNVLGKDINLTLLRSPLAPDEQADQGRQEFTYAFTAWSGPLASSGLVRQGYELNVPALILPGDGGEKSLFALDADTIVIDTVKPAEDGSGDIIVRLYESMRTATPCTLTTALPVRSAEFTDMLENARGPATLTGGAVAMTFRPFEIKTLRLR